MFAQDLISAFRSTHAIVVKFFEAWYTKFETDGSYFGPYSYAGLYVANNRLTVKNMELIRKILNCDSRCIPVEHFYDSLVDIACTIEGCNDAGLYWRDKTNSKYYYDETHWIGMYDHFYILCAIEINSFREVVNLCENGFYHSFRHSVDRIVDECDILDVLNLTDEQIGYIKQSYKTVCDICSEYSDIQRSIEDLIRMCDDMNAHDSEDNAIYTASRRFITEIFNDIKPMCDMLNRHRVKLHRIIYHYSNDAKNT